MKFIILGSGNFLPDTERNCSSHLLETKDEKILFDCGRGAMSSLIKLNINPHLITRIFISHRHADHFSEISSFLALAVDSPVKNKFKDNKLYIYGPRGIKKAVYLILKAIDNFKENKLNTIVIKELSNREITEFPEVSIQAFKVIHSDTANCLAYRIKTPNKIIAYSGDSIDCPGLRKACNKADIAIIESTLPPRENSTHLSGDKAGEIASKAKVKEVIVVHVDKDYLGRVESDIKSKYSGKVVLGKDLMQIEL